MYRKKMILIAAASVLAVPAILPQAHGADLVAHLSFDGHLNGGSGTTYHGTALGPNAPTYVAGRFGQAAYFNNTNTDQPFNDWGVSLAIPGSLYDDPAGFSYSAWVKSPLGTDVDAAIFGNSDWSSGRNPGWLVAQHKGGWFNHTTVDGTRRDAGESGFLTGEWHHVAATFDRATNTAIYYVDGEYWLAHLIEVELLGGETTTASLDAGFDTVFGASANGLWGATDTAVDEFGLWQGVLTPQEIRALASNPIPEPASVVMLCAGGLLLMRRRA